MQIISGQFKSRKLLAPKGQQTRPTSGRLREALFNICQARIEDCNFLDLFAGSGAMGIEALSRGARQAIFIDKNRESFRCIQANLANLGIENFGKVMQIDAFEGMERLAKLRHEFDIIYADPPYEQTASGGAGHSLSMQVAILLDEIIDRGIPLLKSGGLLFVEDASNALPEEKRFKHLILEDMRKMGRSALQQWRNEG